MLGPLIVGLATGEVGSAIRRARSAAIAYMAAAILAVVGLVFLLVAAWIVAARRLGPLEAALWFGGIFLALAVITVVIHRIVAAARSRAANRQRTRDLAAMATTSAIAAVPVLSRSRGGLGILGLGIAALGGYALYRLFRDGDGPQDDRRSRRRRG